MWLSGDARNGEQAIPGPDPKPDAGWSPARACTRSTPRAVVPGELRAACLLNVGVGRALHAGFVAPWHISSRSARMRNRVQPTEVRHELVPVLAVSAHTRGRYRIRTDLCLPDHRNDGGPITAAHAVCR